jgi:CRISPR-associated protein Cas1
MNPLHLSGFGVEVLTSNSKPHAELKITVGRKSNNPPARYLFLPRRIEYDSIILENATGNISLAALRWLSAHNIPIFFLDFDGSTISNILPPIPVKADLRAAQFRAANDPERKTAIARALVQAKIARSLQVLDWIAERYDIEQEVRLTKSEAIRLSKASTVPQIRTVEGRVALRYWEALAKVMPEPLHFQGRMTTSHNNNASDPFNAALNYGYGFIKILCRMAINSVGLEPAVGFLHELSSTQTAESLVHDLEEPFRFLADLCVIQAFETQQLTPHDFTFTRNDYLYRIQWEGKMRLRGSLKEAFNSGANYKGRILKWDTVIEQKALELSRFLTGKSLSIEFSEPSPTLARQDNQEVRERILSLSECEAKELGIGKSELHYLRRKASTGQSFRLYQKVIEKINRVKEKQESQR